MKFEIRSIKTQNKMKCEELTEKCKVGSVTYKVWIFKFELN